VPPFASIQLPSRYYLDHFEEMLDFVTARYAHAIGPRERNFLATFRSLSLNARCLYVRFMNRKGRAFYREHLAYEEITSLTDAIAELISLGFIRHPQAEDFPDLLALQTRPDLFTLVRASMETTGESFPKLSSAKKADLLRFITTRLPFEDCFPARLRERYLVQGCEEEIDYLLFLYFGKRQKGMTTFALRDLGIVKMAGFKNEFEARFETGEVARAAYHYTKILDGMEAPSAAWIERLVGEVTTWPVTDDTEVEQMRHRSIHRLGRELERLARPSEALTVYLCSDYFPATERAVRLLVLQDDRDGAEALLLRLIDNPSCDEELLFAEDFYERKFHRKKVGRLTELLREATVFPLDESARDRPEAALVRHFEQSGIIAAHVENGLWAQLFGLLFWDLLYNRESAALHNPFESRPQDLNSGAFYRRHREAVTERLALLDEPSAAMSMLRETWAKNAGTPNPLLFWDEPLFALIGELVTRAPRGGLAAILDAMGRQFRTNRSGFPDLIVFEGEGVRFVEVKAEGDHIRRHQLVQIERLRKAGFVVEIAKVAWTVDPAQDYVVVDIETTGGNPDWNRITEIGAVRVRGGEVVDEWSSLIYPGRSIPKFIVGLTGITDAMVAKAPPFEAVADAFRAFVGDAVFVAHRVKFDYGFIRSEFGRIGQDFRCPTLCTVVAMHRYFPGLPSYGLGALCRALDIPLESHHRALCDARATAELLKKINSKRVEIARGEHAKTQNETNP
jgi:DNA polymerase III subunit epsilon